MVDESRYNLFSGEMDGSIQMWDLNTRLKLADFDAHAKKKITAMVPYEKFLISGSYHDLYIKIWDTE